DKLTGGGPGTVSGSQTLSFTGTGHILSGQTLTVANTRGATISDGFIDFSGILFGPGSLTKTGTGTLSLDGANNYAGGTQLQGGNLFVGNDTALGSGTLTLSGGTLGADFPVTLANAFRVNGNSQVFNIAFHGFDTTMTFSGAGTLSTGTTLTVEPTSANAHAPIVFSGAIGGDGGLTVSGNDTVTFSGMNANTYTGTTTVNQ